VNEYPSTWRHPWPPDYKTFPAEHVKLIKAWLSKSRHYKDLTPVQRSALANAVVTLDHTAWRMAQELRGAKISIDDLRERHIANLGGMPLARFMQLRPKLDCIDFCEETRERVFGGDWGGAVQAAAFAGRNEVGEFANLGRAAIYKRNDPSRLTRDHKVAQTRLQTLESEVRRLRERHPDWSKAEIARDIQKRRSSERGFASIQVLRKKIAKLLSS